MGVDHVLGERFKAPPDGVEVLGGECLRLKGRAHVREPELGVVLGDNEGKWRRRRRGWP